MLRAVLAAAVAAVAATWLASCSKAEEEFSDEPCLFIFDNSVHQDATLATAMSPMSPGVFCHISETNRSGAVTFVFRNNQGLSSEKRANAKDQQQSRRLGRRNGIIVGYGNGDITNPEFYAYDAQCPACYSGTGLVDRSLSIDSRGVATCGNCHRTYDLNNGGYIMAGGQADGTTNKLTRYHASTTGEFGVLAVTN